MYRLKANVNTQGAISKIAAIFNKYNPSIPYDLRFADQAFNAKFILEVLIGKLAGIFAGLAIFISCLGLFGLAAYVAEQRKKEIGIRIVLGGVGQGNLVIVIGQFFIACYDQWCNCIAYYQLFFTGVTRIARITVATSQLAD
jgi:hypothetical protein